MRRESNALRMPSEMRGLRFSDGISFPRGRGQGRGGMAGLLSWPSGTPAWRFATVAATSVLVASSEELSIAVMEQCECLNKSAVSA